MSGEMDTVPGEAAPTGTPGSSPRPWTPEAAMEPIPPLAPPPARPGAGRAPDSISSARTGGRHVIAGIIVAALLVGALIALVVIAAH